MIVNLVNLLTITGPTASGKTSFAASLASIVDGEIISADSRQIYRGMEIGTGKDYQEYFINDRMIPSHLIDIHDPGYKYSVYEFQQDFLKAYEAITSASKLPILTGGTPMYIDAVLSGYNLLKVPRNQVLRQEIKSKSQDQLVLLLQSLKTYLHNITDTTNRERTIRAIEIALYMKKNPDLRLKWPRLNSFNIGIKFDRQTLKRRITDRLNRRLDAGMIDEVRNLLKTVKPEILLFYGLEYKYITKHIMGELDYGEMFNTLETAIHQFAKRQMTWFRKLERKGIKIHWIDGELNNEQKIDITFKLFKLHNVRFDIK